MCKEIDPDSRDSDRELVEIIVRETRDYIQDHFPHLDHREPAIIESCTYTVRAISLNGSVCVMFKTRAAVFYPDLKPRGTAKWFKTR